MIATESQEQQAFVKWFAAAYPGILCFAIPNGAHLAGDPRMRAIKMNRLKAEGLVPGIPDLAIPEWLLWIELKRTKGGVVSPEQSDIHAYLRLIGQHVIVARGWEDAVAQLRAFRRNEL